MGTYSDSGEDILKLVDESDQARVIDVDAPVSSVSLEIGPFGGRTSARGGDDGYPYVML